MPVFQKLNRLRHAPDVHTRQSREVAKGVLRVYLGAAPGVGKTYAMLDEGWRRAQRGTDVVVGWVETHGRAGTAAQVRDLPIVARRRIGYRGSTLEEMDVDAVLARAPRVALVDELAHTNVPGSRNEKRWQDVQELLAAGIDVVSTVNIQHLESLNDVVERITGVHQRETVPDDVVRRADQIELVDMSPEALRRRMAHGNVYPPERVDAALSNYFRPGNLAALRELALLWVADRVEEGLHTYMESHGIADAWETRERVLVALTGAPGGDDVIRRAARMAGRLRSDLVGLHVVAGSGLATSRAGPELEAQRTLLTQLGGTYREVVGDDVAEALVDFARAERVTQIVLGVSRQGRWHRLVRGSVVDRVARQAEAFDVHVIATERTKPAGLTRPRAHHRRRRVSSLPPVRQAAGWALAIVGLPVLTVVATQLSEHVTLPTVLLLYLALVVAIAAIGGLVVGVVSAVAASLLANWFVVPPLHTLSIGDGENIVALVVFVAVALTVSLLVDRVSTRSRQAIRARAESEALARATATLVGEPDPRPDLLDQLRVTFSLDGVALLSSADDGWTVDAFAGADPPRDPSGGAVWDLAGDGSTVLVVRGPELAAEDQRVLRTFLSQLALAVQRGRLQAEAAEAAHLADANALRTALLQAVSHDLRTPLATIKASATSLLQSDVTWDAANRQEFIRAIDTQADRLNRVVGNLLDMSRLQAGVIHAVNRPVYLEDVVAQALASLADTDDIEVAVPETIPAVEADPALLERVVANVVANAVAWSPADAAVRVEAGEVNGRVHLRVIDRGPGIAPEDRTRVFEPFQRLGDRSSLAGVGLGLAVSRGFVQAVGGDLRLDDTPGGGLTVVIDLPEAS
jgi:two-component system, OmpR family, sensor histidine kinase KdpD